ncbi:hypothetical protein ACW4TU_41570 [Streptomyces sp. QTS52]
MDATVAAGWIGGLAGLGGASVGAMASIWATRNSQKHAAQQALLTREHEVADAKEQRLFELARAALDATLLEWQALGKIIDQYIRQRLTPQQEEELEWEWESPVKEHLERIEALLHRIPEAQVRERLQRVVYVAGREHLAGPTYYYNLMWLHAAVREGVRCTSAHLREEELPPPISRFASNDEIVTEDDYMHTESVNEARGSGS